MSWEQYQDEVALEDEEADLAFSPALMARRASESWINSPPMMFEVLCPALFLSLAPAPPEGPTADPGAISGAPLYLACLLVAPPFMSEAFGASSQSH